jgi:hypothetical protein
MEIERQIRKRYNDLVKFLRGQDALPEPADIGVYEKAVEKYELLHDILQIRSAPRWCS